MTYFMGADNGREIFTFMHDSIGSYLKYLRLQNHMTQAYVAKRLGISRQAYSYYERSGAIPGMELLTQLAELYDLPMQSFCSYIPCEEPQLHEDSHYSAGIRRSFYPDFVNFYSTQDNMKKYHYLNNSEKELLFIFQKLSPSEQNEILVYAYFRFSL